MMQLYSLRFEQFVPEKSCARANVSMMSKFAISREDLLREPQEATLHLETWHGVEFHSETLHHCVEVLWPGSRSHGSLQEALRAGVTFPPGVALDIVSARVRFGAKEQTRAVEPEAQEMTFEFDLEQGKTTLQTWFVDRSGEEFGAYYAYINRADGAQGPMR